MAYRQRINSFIIRIVQSEAGAHFTIQNLNTMRVFELSSWEEAVLVLQGRYSSAPSVISESEPENLSR